MEHLNRDRQPEKRNRRFIRIIGRVAASSLDILSYISSEGSIWLGGGGRFFRWRRFHPSFD